MEDKLYYMNTKNPTALDVEFACEDPREERCDCAECHEYTEEEMQRLRIKFGLKEQ